MSVTTAGTGLTVVNAEPPPTLDQVRELVGELHEEAAEANERLNVATEDVADLERHVDRSENAVERQEEKVRKLTADIGGFAAAAYRNGTDPGLQALLADEPDEFLAQLAVVDAFAGQQTQHLNAIAHERRELEQKRLLAEDDLARMEAVKEVLAAETDQVGGLLAEQEQLLEELTEQQRDTLARQRELEQQQAMAERQAASSRLSRSGSDAPASGRAATAVQAALSKVGSRYVYGGKGPDAFDCSGFTRWAWSQSGVSLSPASRSQIGQSQRISADELQPGDLLFYGSPISHVAMYIGGGQVVHAANPRSGVTTAPAMRAGGSRKPFVGATRPG